MRSVNANTIWLAVLILPATALAIFGLANRPAAVVAASDEGAQASRRPVLVELFTSEGCSSCPPADAVLTRLDAMQPVAGAQAIVLSEHVTYWDNLGWRDPFSLEAMTQRQQQYATHFGRDEVYTPQVVVDGAAQLVGSDERGVRQAVAKAAALPKEELTIVQAQWDAHAGGNSIRFSIQSKADGAKTIRTILMAAIAEDATQSQVQRGENAGRNLRHVAVVRAMQSMGSGAEDGRTLTLAIPANDPAGPIRLVVFEMDKANGRVVAVAEQTITRP
jgi:hypothetical protein